MPPFQSRLSVETPISDHASENLKRNKLNATKLHERMSKILSSTEEDASKVRAIYPVRDTDNKAIKGYFTRAWLVKNEVGLQIVTDQVRQQGSHLEVVPDTLAEHVTIDEYGELHGYNALWYGPKGEEKLLDNAAMTIVELERTAHEMAARQL